MTSEPAFIAALRQIATSTAARGLADDAAVLEIGNVRLVLTMDAIVEGVHFLADDPPDSIAWKLVATNVSDLSAKGATPKGCLLSYPLAQDDAWDLAFLKGLKAACTALAIPLLGGDTVRQPAGSARSFSLVAIGEPISAAPIPSRSGARPGDLLWVSGTIGDAGAGLAILQDGCPVDSPDRCALVRRYRQPEPNIELGAALAPLVTAMMDVSDGLLIDSSRLAAASGTGLTIDLDRIPLSRSFTATRGSDLDQRLFAAGAGDDYCLLFTAPPEAGADLLVAAQRAGGSIYQLGQVADGQGLTLMFEGEKVALPASLGFEH